MCMKLAIVFLPQQTNKINLLNTPHTLIIQHSANQLKYIDINSKAASENAHKEHYYYGGTVGLRSHILIP